jgi:hypothetical protein
LGFIYLLLKTVNTMTTLLHLVALSKSEKLWEFLEVKDVLRLSICSRFCAGLTISPQSVHTIIASNPKLCYLGKFKLSFPATITIGMLRRILNRLQTGENAVVSIDNDSGRVMIDIGSAFNDNNAFLAKVEPIPTHRRDVSSMGSSGEIFKQLEISSFDEYDDFNPRHPLPRDKAHRRGDSYFNSDIEMLANEPMMAFDLASIAKNAIDLEQVEGGSLKHKFMNKGAKNNYPGKPPAHSRVKAALNADSDEDN